MNKHADDWTDRHDVPIIRFVFRFVERLRLEVHCESVKNRYPKNKALNPVSSKFSLIHVLRNGDVGL
jgi:hypothetical protein